MKTVACVSAFAIALLVYSSDAFVPETQGITDTDTVSGLVVLSDTYLAEQVGGDWEGRRKPVKKAQDPLNCSSGNSSEDECELIEGVS